MAGMELMKYNVKRQNEQLIKIIHDGFPANDQVQTQLEALLNKKTNWIKKLKGAWINRKQPVHTEQSIKTMCKQKFAEQRANRIRAGVTGGQNQVEDMEMNPRDWIIKNASGWKGYDPFNNQYFMDPIEFGGEVNFNIFEPLIICDPESKAVNIISSVRNILSKGQEIGLNTEQFSMVFLSFAKKFLPYAYASLSQYSGQTTRMFNNMVELINQDTEVAKIRASLCKISRTPDQQIGIPVLKIKSLYLSLYAIQHPEFEVGKIEKKSEMHTLQCISSLINPETKMQFGQFSKLKSEEDDRMTLTDATNYISSIEHTLQECKLKEVLKLPHAASTLDLSAVSGDSITDLCITMTALAGSGNPGRYSGRDTNFQRENRSKSKERYQYDNRSGGNNGQADNTGYKRNYTRFPDKGNHQDRRSSFDDKNREHNERARSTSQGFNRERKHNQRSPSKENNGRYQDTSKGNNNDRYNKGRQSPGRFGGQQRPASFSGQRGQSPSQTNLKTSNGNQFCVRCGSPNHYASSCPRYTVRCEIACKHCNLFHDENFCNRVSSRYRTPPPSQNYVNPVRVHTTEIDHSHEAFLAPIDNTTLGERQAPHLEQSQNFPDNFFELRKN